jgi:nitronate monooxygenase
VQEIRAWFDGPLALSGAIATGSAILAAEAIGADFAYVGSPFIATPEARCSDEYRQAIVEGGAADIVNSALFTGIPGNYLRSSIAASGLDPDALDKMDSLPAGFGSDGSTRSKAWRDIWGSGQGIGVVDRIQPAADYIAQLERQYEKARGRLCGSTGRRGLAPAAPSVRGRG